MKKSVSGLIVLSMLATATSQASGFSESAITEFSQESALSLGQNIDALIKYSEKQISEGLKESKEASQKIATRVADVSNAHATLILLLARLQALKSAKIINADSPQRRHVVTIIGVGTITAATLLMTAKISNAKVITNLGRAGKLIAVVATVAGGLILANEVGSVLILSDDELKTEISRTLGSIQAIKSSKDY